MKTRKTVVVREPTPFNSEKPAGNNIVAGAIVEATQEAAQELGVKTAEPLKFQFTKRASYRVKHSFYTSELFRFFEGCTDVDLPEVEWQILAFQMRDGKLQDLGDDIGDLPVGSLMPCALQIASDYKAEKVCEKEFLPRAWVVAKSGKPTGSYTPDLGDSVIAVCHHCQDLLCEDVKSFNNKVAPTEQKKIPRFLPRSLAEEALSRRQYAIQKRQEQEERLGALRSKLQIKTTAQEIADLKRRYGR